MFFSHKTIVIIHLYIIEEGNILDSFQVSKIRIVYFLPTGSKKRESIYKLARKHKNLGFRPNLMYISNLHIIGKICMNAKFMS